MKSLVEHTSQVFNIINIVCITDSINNTLCVPKYIECAVTTHSKQSKQIKVPQGEHKLLKFKDKLDCAQLLALTIHCAPSLHL